MKLVNRLMAGQKLALGSGVLTIDAEGVVETDDKAVAAALQASGFKPAFARKEAAEKSAPKSEPKVETKAESKPEPEPVSAPKVEQSKHQHHQSKKGR